MTFDETFKVQWDENDICQVEEDEWISSILGSEEEVIGDILTYI